MIKLRVKEVAQQKRISMGKLSRISDVSFNTIRNMCHNPYYSATTHTLDKLACALGVHPAELLEYCNASDG